MNLRERIEQGEGEYWTEGPYRLWEPGVLLKQAAILQYLDGEIVEIGRTIWFKPTKNQAYYQACPWQPKKVKL